MSLFCLWTHGKLCIQAFYADLQGEIGVVQGRLTHLWHGDLQARHYSQCHTDFAGFQFNPYQDIAIANNDCWRWNSAKPDTAKPDMQHYVSEYFALRQEDD